MWCALYTNAQQANEYNDVDAYVRLVQTSSPDTLSVKLTSPFSTNRHKVRAIYSWICQNIAYNTAFYEPLNRRPQFVPEPFDTLTQWKEADEMVALKVLHRKKAVCDGYARLFKVLCNKAGIEAVLVNGYVRTTAFQSTDRFATNHTWNAVNIDNVWYLIDVTWGAGFLSYANAFVAQQNDFYFLPKPEELIQDHYPEDLRWSLMSAPPAIREFDRSPFKSKSFVKYGIVTYAPQKGNLPASTGDTLSFSILLKDVKRAQNIIADPSADTGSFLFSPQSVFVNPQKQTSAEIVYSIVVANNIKWVHLLFNGDVVLRYYINTQKPLLAVNR